jgi:predicted phage terminase large subunit-like protein
MTFKPSPALFNQLLKDEFPFFLRKAVASLLPQGVTLSDNWHIDAVAFVLANIITGVSQRLIINLPPQFLKSMICSVALPAFLLGRNPGTRIMCVSYNADLANSLHGFFLRLVQSSWYRQAFDPRPIREVADWYETEQGGRRYAMSVDGKLTGFPADLIIIDDPLNANDAFSEQKREAVNAVITGAVFSRLSNKSTGRILFVMQRLHAEDPSGHFLARGGWEHLCLPAIAPVDRVVQLPYGKTYAWKQGEPLHANFCGLDTLDQIKREVGTPLFNAQYLQEPMLAGEALLKLQYLRTYPAARFKGPNDIIVQSWDTAVKDTPTSDYSVGLTFLARGKQIFLLDVYRGRVEFPDLRREALCLAAKYKPDFILIEEAANGAPLLQSLRDQPWQIIGVRPDIAKEARVARHTYTLEADPLYLPQYAAWVDDFRAEFISFPHARHDDQVDALAQFYLWYDGHQRKVPFSFDMGFAGHNGSACVGRLTAPSPNEIWDLLGGSGLGRAL